MKKQIIPIFFACDDNYAPFLSVAITSMLENADKSYFYRIHILTSGFCRLYAHRIETLADENSEIVFVDPTPHLKYIAEKLHLRDYYSITTYYRLFIADMFPQYDRALYLDADTVITGDISELYFTDIRGNALGAVQEDVMNAVNVFGTYAEVVVGVPRASYFSAGVLVMDMKVLRELKTEEKFAELLKKHKFDVTQDEDYLNALFYGNTELLGYEWNKSPDDTVSGPVKSPKLIHFKLNWKPWHYDGLAYADIFWNYAEKSAFAEEIRFIRRSFDSQCVLNDRLAYEKLMKLATARVKEYSDVSGESSRFSRTTWRSICRNS